MIPIFRQLVAGSLATLYLAAPLALADSPRTDLVVVAEKESGTPGTDQVTSPDESVPLSADQIVANVNAVDEGEQVTRTLEMALTDRRNKERVRRSTSFRKSYEGQRKTVLFYLEPSNVRGTGFLIWDQNDIEEKDHQWLYLPALRKVRRISAADRGDYFLGTDFTYEDTKLDGKLEPSDYHFTLLEPEVGDAGATFYNLQAIPRSPEIARELGYSRSEIRVDASNWVIVAAKFWDLEDTLLKSLEVSDVQQIDGIWTRMELLMVNHQTQHQTRYRFSDVDYQAPVSDSLFTTRALERGL